MTNDEMLRMILEKVDRLQDQLSHVITRVAVFDSVFEALDAKRRRAATLLWSVGGTAAATIVAALIGVMVK